MVQFNNYPCVLGNLNGGNKIAVIGQKNRSLNLMLHAQLNQIHGEQYIDHLLFKIYGTTGTVSFGETTKPHLES